MWQLWEKTQGRKRVCGIYNCQVMEEGDSFASKFTWERYKIRQNINCESKNVIYLVECKKCGKQGVGSTEDFKPRISNYISHILMKRATCKSVRHFYVTPGHSVKDFSIKGNVKLTNPSMQEKARDKILTEFEGYCQTKLMTLEPYGLNGKDEWARMRNNNKRKSFLRY